MDAMKVCWISAGVSSFIAGYQHLPLDHKIAYLARVTGFDQVSVCEDVDEHFAYWRECVNANKNDCCNLRRDAN